MAAKVKFGLKNAYYAVATIDSATGAASYGTPKRLPGAVSISLEPSGENTPFYADDVAYFVTGGNTGYTGELELALITDDFRKDCLGEDQTTEAGVSIELGSASPTSFALLFEFTTDDKAQRHVFYNCTATRPTIAGTTKGETTEVSTETITVTATPVYNAAVEDNIVKAKANSTATPYDTWYTNVWQPTSSPEPGPSPEPDPED